jgi:hypothetical protein
MYESDDIINYLYDTYVPYGDVSSSKFKGVSTLVSLSLSSLPRRGRGSAFSETKFKSEMKPVIFWGYEVSTTTTHIFSITTTIYYYYYYHYCYYH